MATRKRNEWLEAEESDDDERGYNSEDEGRAHTLPSSKRQKVEHSSENEDEASDDDDGQAYELEDEASDEDEDEDEDDDDDDDDGDDDAPSRSKNAELARLENIAASLPKDLKLASGTLLTDSLEPKKDKSGVIYISRVPPFMKPMVLRSLLTPYGAVGRIFLTPEDHSKRQQRLKNGGTRRKLFLDGWVEFLKKKDAKFVADNLNAQTMGGKKRGRWHDEVWNIKYLSGVKWSHLVEQIQNENAERAARLRFEIGQSRKENKAFLENVEKGKMISGMEAKRKERGQDADGGAPVVVEKSAEGGNEKPKRSKDRREFVQHAAMSKGDKKPEPGQNVQKVLSSIF